mmetsp:Transcript_6046/g.13089  ORF Transcript_6046/g.13089 Transcript_6046/m.13089 type:complete len:263 (-) Transcript_6046:681-1469(-)
MGSHFVHPCESPAVLLADAFHPVRLLPMALVRYETIHMLSQIDLTMKLCFLVHAPLLDDLFGITNFLITLLCDTYCLLQLLVAVLQKHVGVVVQNCQPSSWQVRGILWRKSASQADVLQDDVGIAILAGPDNASGVVPDVLHSVLRPFSGSGTVVSRAEESAFPLFTSRGFQQPAGGFGLELVPIMSVLHEELTNLVQVDMYNQWRQLPDPRKCHEELCVSVPQVLHSLLQLRQRSLVVLLSKVSNVTNCRLLAWSELGSTV